MSATVVATPEMAAYCFDVIIAALNYEPEPKAPKSIPNVKIPLFVTWKKGPRHDLRGCIGTFGHDKPLPTTLLEYAKTSAFRDTRFDPISPSECPELHCGVSLLIHFERAKDYLDWEVGKHGIHIHFTVNGRGYSGVYLPEVAAEQGWNKIQTIDHLLRKAGHRDGIDNTLRQSIIVERFQSSKITISYDEYRSIKTGKPMHPVGAVYEP
uniref:AMMECR1 domain-containing protein n=1 Tax=Panagrellus redivivus TaxID=6233 RepID=A0A7E4UM63_PANRE